MSRLPPIVIDTLERTGLPWTLERGSRHNLIKSGTHLLGIVGRTFHEQDRHLINLLTTIRRNARKIQKGEIVKARDSDLN